MRRWQRNLVDGIITSVPSAAEARAPWPWDKRKALEGFCPSEHDDHGWGRTRGMRCSTLLPQAA
jgi:hypothetical protein